MKINVTKINSNPNQPRRTFQGIEELSASIKTNGLLEPIMVRPIDSEYYEIIHGERRFRALVMAGLTEIEATVREATQIESLEFALIENLQRDDLTPIEEARSYDGLQKSGYIQADIAKLIGKTQSYVAHKLRLLKLPESITYYLETKSLTENHIRQIAKLEGIYGDDLLRGLPDEIKLDGVTTNQDAALLLCCIRPESKVILIEPKENEKVVIDACQVFCEYVLKHKSQTLQWAVAGFWWASLAVLLNLTVAQLARALDSWEERFNSALFYWHEEYKEGKPPAKGEEQKLYWGYFSDLHHSAALHIDENIKLFSLDARINRIDRIINAGGTYPSEFKFKKFSDELMEYELPL